MEYCAYCGNPVQAVSYAPCPKCGNPTNGAARLPARGSNAGLIIGIIAAVLFIPAIIGILAAIAIPNMLTAMQRSKQKRTMADIRSIAVAAEAYAAENGSYPQTIDQLEPRYMPKAPAMDGWGRRFDYDCVAQESDKCTRYAIRSGGKDGLDETPDLAEAVATQPGGTKNFDCDIIYSNGSFVEYPEGVQH
jgi:type II secretory pathway pseudopilin PulG